jgi:transcriptional antiterminator
LNEPEQDHYISLEHVRQELKVARGTIYYYIRQLHIPMKKFPLDRKAYIALEDLERIKAAKKAAVDGRR